MHLAAVLAPTQPALEFGHRRLERGIEAVGTRLAADYRPAPPRGDLDALTGFALATVAFVVEFDVEEIDGLVESLQAGEFLRDVDAEMIGDLDVAALEYDLGTCRSDLLFRSGRAVQNLGSFHGWP